MTLAHARLLQGRGMLGTIPRANCAHLLSLTVQGPSAESTPNTEKRGASSAICGSIPKSSMLEITCIHHREGLADSLIKPFQAAV